MKIWKKIAAVMLAFAVAVSAIPMSAIPVRAEAAEGNPLRLWYDEPASQGVNILSAGSGYGSYQPWGDIYFDYTGISTSVTEYQRDLDLATGISSVSFNHNGTDYYREYFISHDDNVLVARLEADGSAKLNLDVRFTSKQGGTTTVSGSNTLVLCGQVSDNQLKYASCLTVVPEGGSVTGSGSKLTVSGADAITVYLSAATDYKKTFWNEDGSDDYYYRTGETDAELAARVLADVNAAVASGYEAVKAFHLADYQELFNRVDLQLGQTVSEKTTDQLLAAYKNGSATEAENRQLEVMLFQYGRYLTISSSREDSQLPSNLQGVWNMLNNPTWASDYHMNINLQMNYWPTYSTNLAVVRDGLEIANLTWNAVEGASYNVYRASGAADPVLLASGVTETTYTDKALDTAAASVTYYVTAVMGGIESIYSTGVTLTAPAGFGMIDNLDQRIAYAGGWANWSESVNYNGSIMYLEGGSYSTDATVTLQFIGTGIEVITCTNHDRSYMEVIIDGVSCGEEQEKPAENPFIDVKESDYFYKAVLWAVEEGIVYGLSSDRFGPYSPCTRAQMVTFLYRLCK